MTEYKSSSFFNRVRRTTVAFPMAITLFCVSSPLVATSAAWAQQPILNGEQPNTGSTAISLGQIAIPVLIRTLQGNGSQDSSNSGSVLDNISREAVSAAVPALVQALQGGDNRSQVSSNSTSNSAPDEGNIAETATSTVPALIKSLQGTTSLLRLASAFTSGLLGNEGGVLSSLIATLKDPDDSVRLIAALTLDKIGVGLQEKAKLLSNIELDQAISFFDSALKIVTDPQAKFPDDIIAGILNPLEFLKQERIERSPQQSPQQSPQESPQESPQQSPQQSPQE